MAEIEVKREVWLANEADLDGFRRHARECLRDGIEPSQLEWRVATRAEGELFAGVPNRDEPTAASESTASVKVPAFFIPLLGHAALHADPGRFGLLYRLLWRLVDDPALRHDPLDADRQQVEQMARSVRRDMHKMTAFVRFRPLAGADGADGASGEAKRESIQHVAWFEPEHHIVQATAPFFARRFAQMRWAILTPERCVQWDGATLSFGPGADRRDAPPADAAEQLWLTYYANIFNPARLKLAMMQMAMPRRYWKNLPEAALIRPLAAGAAQREQTMLEQRATEPLHRRPAASKALAVEGRPIVVHARGSFAELRSEIEGCRECPICALATQAVNGEGNENARLMLVGEQPGDREDLHGRPFVGPAGQMLTRALEQLGWPHDRLYLTNAVKHFKFELRGKRRIHKTASQREAAACLHWLESEIALVKPAAAIALGATAARALLGRAVPVTKERGQWSTREDGLRVLITLHPSALLRMEPAEQESAFRQWVADLALAARDALD